jgi:hypothetical protein
MYRQRRPRHASADGGAGIPEFGLMCSVGTRKPHLPKSSPASRRSVWRIDPTIITTATHNLSPDSLYVLAAIWGAGNETISLAAGSAHGTAEQEAIIRYVIYTATPSGIIAFTLILWGLRLPRTKTGLLE